MRRFLTTAATAGLIVVGLAAPSWAHDGWHAVQPWETLDTDDGTGDPYPGSWSEDLVPTPSETSQITGPHSATLEWPEDGPNLGTSIETQELGLEVPDGTQVSVNFTLDGGAECTGGAPRVFVFIDGKQINSDDNCDGSLTIDQGGKIGYAGIVYDNGVPGKVEVKDLIIGDRLISFQPPPKEVAPKAPTIKQFKCSDNDFAGEVIIPDQDGVIYYGLDDRLEAGKYEVKSGKYEVTAEPHEGYKFTDSPASWKLKVEPVDECEKPDDEGQKDDDEKGKVTEEDEDTRPAASTLPDTGADSNTGMLALIGGIIVALGAGALVLRRYIPLPGGRYRSGA